MDIASYTKRITLDGTALSFYRLPFRQADWSEPGREHTGALMGLYLLVALRAKGFLVDTAGVLKTVCFVVPEVDLVTIKIGDVFYYAVPKESVAIGCNQKVGPRSLNANVFDFANIYSQRPGFANFAAGDLQQVWFSPNVSLTGAQWKTLGYGIYNGSEATLTAVEHLANPHEEARSPWFSMPVKSTKDLEANGIHSRNIAFIHRDGRLCLSRFEIRNPVMAAKIWPPAICCAPGSTIVQKSVDRTELRIPLDQAAKLPPFEGEVLFDATSDPPAFLVEEERCIPPDDGEIVALGKSGHMIFCGKDSSIIHSLLFVRNVRDKWIMDIPQYEVMRNLASADAEKPCFLAELMPTGEVGRFCFRSDISKCRPLEERQNELARLFGVEPHSLPEGWEFWNEDLGAKMAEYCKALGKGWITGEQLAERLGISILNNDTFLRWLNENVPSVFDPRSGKESDQPFALPPLAAAFARSTRTDLVPPLTAEELAGLPGFPDLFEKLFGRQVAFARRCILTPAIQSAIMSSMIAAT